MTNEERIAELEASIAAESNRFSEVSRGKALANFRLALQWMCDVEYSQDEIKSIVNGFLGFVYKSKS